MALKTNFEDADFIASPFVDEIANPGDGILAQTMKQVGKNVTIQNTLLGNTPAPSAQISEADRAAKIAGTADERAQNEVNLAEARYGNKAGNKNRDKAEGR